MYTGNTSSLCTDTFLGAVYPCVYREHDEFSGDFVAKRGLSLCIQGTQEIRFMIFKILRFIPVYTGNTSDGCVLFAGESVYPCVYREHV